MKIIYQVIEYDNWGHDIINITNFNKKDDAENFAGICGICFTDKFLGSLRKTRIIAIFDYIFHHKLFYRKYRLDKFKYEKIKKLTSEKEHLLHSKIEEEYARFCNKNLVDTAKIDEILNDR